VSTERWGARLPIEPPSASLPSSPDSWDPADRMRPIWSAPTNPQPALAVPRLFTALVDDAAGCRPGDGMPLADALAAHVRHAAAWYAPLVGPLLIPADATGRLRELLPDGGGPALGLVGNVTRLTPADMLDVRQVEMSVAKRGEDPVPGVRRLLEFAARFPEVDVYAEIPLTWGLSGALDTVAQARGDGVRIAAKFRTGGLAAELFPTPVELAAVICACRDRDVPFKLTAGLHRAIRHNEPETGFTHHGFLNILAATLAAAEGAEVVVVAERLATTDPVPLIEVARANRGQPRPLWTGFGSSRVDEPLADLTALGLLVAETEL